MLGRKNRLALCSINSELKAGVAWYGRLDNQVTQNQPRHPINVADDLKCSVLGLYGGQDHLIPNELVEKMNLNLSNNKKNSMIVTYPQSDMVFLPTTEVVTIKRMPSPDGVNYWLGSESMRYWNNYRNSSNSVNWL